VTESFTLLDAGYAAARWGWYLTVFLVLGAAGYAPFLLRARTALSATHPGIAAELARRSARIGLWASVFLLGFLAIRLYLQSRTLLEPGEPVTADFLEAVIGTGWGRGWLRQAAMGLLALLGFAAATRASRFGWMVAAAASGGLGLVAGMTGHAATERGGELGFVLNAAHIWAGGFWLGGLAVLLLAGLAACRGLSAEERPGLVRTLVADFSRRALVFGPLAIGLGVWLAIRYLGWRWPLELFDTSYGTALAVKLIALAGVAAIGAYNWRVVQPSLTQPVGETRLRSSSVRELVLGAILLAATAVLVALPLPGDQM
jgi:putative copper export protein